MYLEALINFSSSRESETKVFVRRKYFLADTLSTVTYTASSPDELALVEAAKDLGVAYVGDGSVETCTKKRHFAPVEVLEFTSARKRMSILLKDETGNFLLLTKGAESHVLPLVAKGQIDTIKGLTVRTKLFQTLVLQNFQIF